MAELRLPRRPAILSPARAEAIIGDEDPAAASEIAHSTAWALLGIPDEDFDLEAITRLRSLVCAQGPDIVAQLWSRSPEFTLPGTLWRLHLFIEWCERDLPLVKDRYEVGRQAEIVPAGMEVLSEVPLLGSVIEDAKALLRGELTDDDLERVAVQAGIAMRVLAAGEGGEGSWITDPGDPLAHMVTTRARALLKTAEELDLAAREAAFGNLE